MLRYSKCVVVAALAASLAGAQAASRYGGPTDDSVCDVGDMSRRAAGMLSPDAYVKATCRNGQALIGSSVVPLGSAQSDIALLAVKSCVAADIEIRRSSDNVGGVVMEIERVRCRISKLPK